MSYVTTALVGCAFVAFVLFGRQDGAEAGQYEIRIHGLAADSARDAVVEVAPVGGVTPIGGE